ncbi:NUDIX domain-containing protein [Salinirubellus salinus]|uniref:NUDIX domain-containing protein n=1 Tax=Salinirubellus salinus TaxID=1364945 RepID=A0A9E7R543_9EURY|nr:NUDIX domain-containing protein [Salinirubellus salinus]UWM55528.1 NUDIX domain-containing protein [Salinirubellus salinus]
MTHYNRTEVERRLEQLEAEYDPVLEHEDVTLEEDEFAEFLTHAADGYTGGGYAWVVREEPRPLSESMPELDESYPRVLLAMGRGVDGWGPAGGGREEGETYEAAAEREVSEETGVECSVVGCRRVRRATFRAESGGDDVAHTLWVYFTAHETGGSIDVQESELDGAAWFREVPSRWHWAVADHPWTWDAWD